MVLESVFPLAVILMFPAAARKLRAFGGHFLPKKRAIRTPTDPLTPKTQNPSMPRRNITKWNHVMAMCLASFPRRSDEEVEIMTMKMAHQQAKDEVAAFEHECGMA
jgi:hypothetical protein